MSPKLKNIYNLSKKGLVSRKRTMKKKYLTSSKKSNERKNNLQDPDKMALSLKKCVNSIVAKKELLVNDVDNVQINNSIVSDNQIISENNIGINEDVSMELNNNMFELITVNNDSFSEKKDIKYKNTEYKMEENDNPQKQTAIIKNFLKKWTVENNIMRTHLNYLIQFLNQIFPDIPIDYKTLLQTPTKTNLISVPPGSYVHIGIKNNIINLLSEKKAIPKTLTIDTDVDGLPIYINCTEKGFWVILGRIQELKNSVFPIGVYKGETKPQNFNVFLKPYVEEMLNIIGKFEYEGHSISIKTGLFPMDNPARSACTGVIQYNGYRSCPRCLIPGKSIGRTMTFYGHGYEFRTDTSFRKKEDSYFHHGTSELEQLPIDMVNDILLDPLHVVYLGNVKKLLKIWFDQRFHYFPHCVRSNVGEKMLKLNKFLPYEFHREARKIEEYAHFKGHDFRNFVLRFGVYVLKNEIPKAEYNHFLILHVAISILCNKDTMLARNSIAHELLLQFVDGIRKLYGERNVVPNFHYLLHLAEQTIHTRKTLDAISTFEFENYMSPIKEYVHANHHPLQQIHRRVQENHNSNNLETVKTEKHNVSKKSADNPSEFVQIFHKGYKLDKSIKNRYLFKNKTVYKIEKIFESQNSIKISVRKVLKQCDYYDTPVKSSKLNIFICENLWSELVMIDLNDFERKMFGIELENNMILFFPLSKFGEIEF